MLVVAGMVSKRRWKGKWQDAEVAGAAGAGRPRRIPLRGIDVIRLARKIAGPGQRRLVGEAFKKNFRAIGES